MDCVNYNKKLKRVIDVLKLNPRLVFRIRALQESL